MLWWASDDIRTRQTPLAILAGVMVFAGVGKLVSGVQYGFGSRVLAVAAAGEVLVPVALWMFGGWS